MKNTFSFRRRIQGGLWAKAICAGLLLTLAVQFLPFAAACETISNDVLRLHILANSDSQEDQALKLKVRDAVLLEAEKWYGGASSFEQANTAVCTHLQTIQKAAEQTLAANGSPDKVTARVTEKYFTTRHYEGFSLPAGKYRTLQIEIGEAKGQNWWCMVYPALCIPSSSRSETDILSDLPPGERQIIAHPKEYEVKFKVVEWFEKLKEQLEQK